jgi:hypothetical protein
MCLVRIFEMKQTARVVSLFGLLFALSSACFSRPKDVLGWELARWGMTDQDIVRVFGSKAKKQPDFEQYGSGLLGYIVTGINLRGHRYAAYFRMDEGKLGEVDVRFQQMQSRVPREDLFNGLESLLTHRYGAPDGKTDERSSEKPIKFLSLVRTWRFATTTVELSYGWNEPSSSNLMVRYFPSNAREELPTTHN